MFKKYISLIIIALFSCLISYGDGKRVLFIGDSITDGAWGNSNKWNATSDERNHTDMNHIFGHGYMMLCASYYQGIYPDCDYVFWNRGISGNTLHDLHNRWQNDVLNLHPDVVSILVGTNDVDQALGRGEVLDVEAWDAEYRHLLDSTKSVLPDVQFVICTPFVAKVGRLKGTDNYDQREQTITQLDACLRQIAKDYNAVLVPFDELFHSLQSSVTNDNETYWIWDGIHPTPAGHYRMAELWKEKAGRLLECSKLQHGDLLFNVHVKGTDFGDAIVSATKGDNNVSISHVAIVVKENGETKVLEATGKHGVWMCPIDTFLNNSDCSNDGKPLVMIGRLKDRSTINESVERAKKYLGRPYDWIFSDTDEALYCSELVHLAYLNSEGNYIFPQQPMSFHDNTGTILPYWIDYYKQKGLEVPEGKPGTNPSDMSKSSELLLMEW